MNINFLKNKISKLLGPHGTAWARKHLAKYVSVFFSKNLHALATIYGTDKEVRHNYGAHYQHHFSDRRRKRVNILEIGIGGYDNPLAGGASLRMWKRYFPNSTIHGIDVFNKELLQEHRIRTYQGSQADANFLCELAASIGPIHIVIDDGSHINSHVISSFEILFPKLSAGGIYVIEDLQTAYWPRFGGKLAPNECGETTSIEFLKARVDGLNYAEFLIPDYQPSYFDRHIASIHFYHNICFVYKK